MTKIKEETGRLYPLLLLHLPVILTVYIQYFTNMNADLKKLVGQRLQALRMERNMTQEQVSEMLHLSTSAYCKMEYGETDITLTRLNQIAEAFEMSAAELFSRIDGGTYINQPRDNAHGNIWITKDNSTVNVDNNDDLRELVKSNNKLIELLAARLEQVEKTNDCRG